MMIDTHCHLDIDDYEDVELVIKNMNDNIMIASGASLDGSKRVIELVNSYDNIYGTIGIHPSELDDMNNESLEYIENNLSNPKIVGVGEIGLDYYWDKENKEKQKEYFIKQIKLAKKYNKTIVIHSREASLDTVEIIKEYLNGYKVVMHCYSYSLETAKVLKKLGVKFGIGGVLTFKNSNKLKEVVEYLELSDILLETDSPYLSPEPYRGKKNEPKNVYLVAKEIAKIKNVEVDEVLKITTSNALRWFDLHI